MDDSVENFVEKVEEKRGSSKKRQWGKRGFVFVGMFCSVLK
jgi:hypothetical protein